MNKYVFCSIIIGIATIVRFSTAAFISTSVEQTVNEFAIGVIASTFVVLLITIFDDCEKRKENKVLICRILTKLYASIVLYFELFCNACAGQDISLRSEKKTFIEWYSLYLKMIENVDYVKIEIDDIRWFLDKICEEANRVLEQESVILSNHIMTTEDIDSIKDIADAFAMYKIIYIVHDYDSFIRNISEANNEIVRTLEKIEGFKYLVVEPYSQDYRALTYKVQAIRQAGQFN